MSSSILCSSRITLGSIIPTQGSLLTRLFSTTLSHIDSDTGRASMVDVSQKNHDSHRSASASATVLLGSHAFGLVKENTKGDVLSVSQLAGIMGAKHTSTLIPLCHPLLLTHVSVDMELDEDRYAVDICATVKTVGSTGVEMEALTAVSISALTVYDMCKAASKEIEITDIVLVEKTGGKGGPFHR
jgi:cyclic pyranopterin phosphate synthase